MDIKRHDTTTLWLRTELASGETAKGEKFSASLNIDNSCLIFMFPEATYTIGLKTLVDAVMDFRTKERENQQTGEVKAVNE